MSPNEKEQYYGARGIQPPPGKGPIQIYMIDPTGFSVQWDGMTSNPPSNLPTYSAACKSNDGCAGRGICSIKDFFFIQ